MTKVHIWLTPVFDPGVSLSMDSVYISDSWALLVWYCFVGTGWHDMNNG